MASSGMREVNAAKKDGRWAKAYDSAKTAKPPADFLRRLNTTSPELKQCLMETWKANKPLAHWDTSPINKLVAEKYNNPDWNLKW